MITAGLVLGLTHQEAATVRRLLGREPNETEWAIIDAEWSEHSSYKSSRALLKLFPTSGKRVLLGPGYDAGVIDVGEGDVVTLHIESHNHPSAVDPYGGASTGIGGVLRDILSMGTRPIALLDVLRFGDPEASGHSRWLLRNVVKGIADYGNCLSENESVYYTESGKFRVAKASELVEALASQNRLSHEYNADGLTISRPLSDLRLLSFDFGNSEAQFRRVSRVYEAKASRLVRIKTGLGREIEVTPDHPMFLVRDGQVTAIQAKSLRPGDSLPIACDFPYPVQEQEKQTAFDLIDELKERGAVAGITVKSNGRKLREFKEQLDPLLRQIGVSSSRRCHYFGMNYLPLNELLSVESLSTFRLPREELLLYPRRGNATKIPAIINLDKGFSRLVGYYLAEGCVHDEEGAGGSGRTSRVVWTFRRDESEYIHDVCSILDGLRIRYTKRATKTNSVQVRVSSRILGWFFSEVLGAGENSYNKVIPSIFYSNPLELNLELLKGVLRGDGSLRTSNSASIDLRFGSSSQLLFQQILLLLQSLSYVPSCSVSFHTGSSVPFYELTICGRARIEALKVNFSSEIVAKANGRLALYTMPSMEHYRSVSLGRFASVKIVQIEEVEGDFSVFNFEVEGTHNYVTSGGIITHNCVGVPTVAGDIEFDESFEKNCLVDVACVGVGKKGLLTLGEAKRPGDAILMVGGSTGRDGVGGASFASKNLAKGPESERRSVQVPDPFMKKLLLDSLLEVVETGLLHGMKDLGGGGLSTGLSEIAAKGGTGVDVELSRVRQREGDMSPREIMTSESQERMLLVLDPKDAGPVVKILDKYGVPHSVIGTVTGDGSLKIRWKGAVEADLPAQLVAEAPLVAWPARRPPRPPAPTGSPKEPEISKSLLALLSSPNISSRRWVYEQYDHEVGLRTVVKPGGGDAALLRLPNGSMLAAKADANSRHSSLDPRRGAAGCVAEACRNVVTLGAEPVALVDHLQFGDPSDPEVYWAFRETVEGMAEYCRGLPIPVVGGKVSFYNEDASTKRAIKPSPVAMVVGISPGDARRASAGFRAEGESVYLLGRTRKEMGASEYYERVLKVSAGVVPKADPLKDSVLFRAMIRLVRAGTVSAVHDCSRGGLAVALAEMCIPSRMGAELDIAAVRKAMTPQEALFSESHGRFVVSTRSTAETEAALKSAGVEYARLGSTGGTDLALKDRGRQLARLDLDSLAQTWESPIGRLMA